MSSLLVFTSQADPGMLRRFDSILPFNSRQGSDISNKDADSSSTTIQTLNFDENYSDEESESEEEMSKTRIPKIELINSVLGLQVWKFTSKLL